MWRGLDVIYIHVVAVRAMRAVGGGRGVVGGRGRRAVAAHVHVVVTWGRRLRGDKVITYYYLLRYVHLC